MNFQRAGGYPFAVFIITAILSNFANIDFRIEIGSECLVVITGITVNDIQILYFIKVVFCRIGCINTTYPRIETATENSCQSGFLKTFVISPLPTVFKMSLVFRLIIGCVQIVYSGFKAGLHDGEILIGEGNIDYHFRFEVIEQSYQFIYVICVYFSRFYIGIANCFYYIVTFGFSTAGNHDVSKYTARTDNKNSTHFFN